MYYLLTGKFKKLFGAIGANLWVILNVRYINKRRESIKKLIPEPYSISDELMKQYSIVQKYFIEGIKFYKDIN